MLSKLESNWQYAEQYAPESAQHTKARRLSLELGIKPVSRATANQLTQTALISSAENICEIGTGVGLSALALLAKAPKAHLTSIDIEPEFHRLARPIFDEALISSARLRLIEGDARKVLPRLNTSAYDLLLIDADQKNLLEYVEHGLQLVRPGGSILVPNALWQGQVADPAARDEITTAFRDLLAALNDSEAVFTSLSPVGEGLLTITRLQ